MWAVPEASMVYLLCAGLAEMIARLVFGLVTALRTTERTIIQAVYLIYPVNAYSRHSHTKESYLHAEPKPFSEFASVSDILQPYQFPSALAHMGMGLIGWQRLVVSCGARREKLGGRDCGWQQLWGYWWRDGD